MELTPIYIEGLPIGLADRAREHHDGLTRELVLIAQGHGQDPAGSKLPQRLLDLIAEVRSSYSSFGAAPTDRIDAAREAGAPTVDLVYSVPRSIGPAIAEVGALLDEADDFCRSGEHLLTLATPLELVAYRHWYLSQFIVQAAGGPPTPWPGSAVPSAGEP